MIMITSDSWIFIKHLLIAFHVPSSVSYHENTKIDKLRLCLQEVQSCKLSLIFILLDLFLEANSLF